MLFRLVMGIWRPFSIRFTMPMRIHPRITARVDFPGTTALQDVPPAPADTGEHAVMGQPADVVAVIRVRSTTIPTHIAVRTI